jgi:hypothetical protein
MATCRCTSKKHGHGDRCERQAAANNDFCDECNTQMATDRATQDEPNLTPTDTPTGKIFRK